MAPEPAALLVMTGLSTKEQYNSECSHSWLQVGTAWLCPETPPAAGLACPGVLPERGSYFKEGCVLRNCLFKNRADGGVVFFPVMYGKLLSCARIGNSA
jgi:hypothetical protein